VLLLMLITLLNDGTLITIGYDSVRPSQHPEVWNLRALFTVSIELAGVAVISSLLLVWAALDAGNPGSVFKWIGLPDIEYGQIVMMIYLKVSISDFLTLFSARTRSFFFTAKPGNALMAGGAFALSLSTILACVWPIGDLDSVPVYGLARDPIYHYWPIWVWVYCIVWWFIQDILKVLTYAIIYKFHIFGAVEGEAVSQEALRGAEQLTKKSSPHDLAEVV